MPPTLHEMTKAIRVIPEESFRMAAAFDDVELLGLWRSRVETLAVLYPYDDIACAVNEQRRQIVELANGVDGSFFLQEQVARTASDAWF